MSLGASPLGSRPLGAEADVSGATYTQGVSGSITASSIITTKLVFVSLITGTLTLSSLINKQTERLLISSITLLGIVFKRIPLRLFGTLTLTNTLIKKTSRLLSASITIIGNLTPSFISFQVLAGSITMNGTVSGIIVILVPILYKAKRLYYRMLGRR